MKRYLVQQMLAAGLGILIMPSAFAQTEKNPQSADAKEYQQIIINRKTPANEKTVIEINGDKIKINGKEVSNNKEEDITVRISKIKDLHALQPQPPFPPGFRGRNLNLNEDEKSLLNKIKDWNALQGPMAPGFKGRNFDLNEDEKSLLNADSNRAMLGVMTEGNEKGAEIKSVSKESAAEKAGLQTGDIITKIDDKKITNAEDVAQEVRKHKPGDKISITLLRDGKEQKVTAELGRWKGLQMNTESFRMMDPEMFKKMLPNMPSDPFVFRDRMKNDAPKLGISVQDTEEGKGVKVLDVEKESNAAKAGIKANDIITHVGSEPVNSVDEIARKIRDNKDKGSVLLKVRRNGKTQNIEVQLPRKLKSADL